MNAVEQLIEELSRYFASVRARAGHVFSLRDFNSQVMMNTYAPEERDVLGVALERLVEVGILLRQSPTEFVLTAQGASLVPAPKTESQNA